MADNERRIELDDKLRAILGSSNVYFQPPDSKLLEYPCIIYNREKGDTRFANDMPYIYSDRYTVMCIYKDPDSDLVQKIALGFSMCMHDRHYVADNLNHDTFDIYY